MLHNIYVQSKEVCNVLSLDGLVKEYHLTTRDPAEVAKVYSAAYPITQREAVTEGCRAGLVSKSKP
jgi:hypothetical protein